MAADPHAYVPPELMEVARWEDPARQELIEEQRLRHLKENSQPPTLHAARKRRATQAHPRDARERQLPDAVSPRVLVAGMADSSDALRSPQIHRRRGGAPWKGIATAVTPRGAHASHVDSDDDEDDWDSVRQRFGGDRQGTLEIREGDGNILVVKPFSEPPADTLPSATIQQPRRRAAGASLQRPERAEGTDRTDVEDSVAGTTAAAPVTDFFADDEGPRPATNAPQVAERRALDLATMRQRPAQSEPRKQRSRRASVNLPTFEAGGQDFRILPRRRGKQS